MQPIPKVNPERDLRAELDAAIQIRRAADDRARYTGGLMTGLPSRIFDRSSPM